MAVTEQTPVTQHAGNGLATAFAYNFLLLQASDLKVSVNGIVLTGGYTVSGVGNASGGSVLMSTPPASGAVVLLYRQTIKARPTDYQESGDLLAQTVNRDFDRVVMMVQEAVSGASTNTAALRAPSGETLLPLPSAAERALRVQAYDAAGQPVLIPGVDPGSATALAMDLASGAVGKGSKLVAFIQRLTGAVQRWVEDKFSESVSVLDFGADPTGVASALAAFQAATDAARRVYVPPGTYRLDGRWLITQDNTAVVLGPNVTLQVSGYTWNGTQSPFGNQIHITGDGCSIVGSGPSSLIQLVSGSQANGIGLLHATGLLVRDLVLDGGKAGVTGITDDTFQSGISIICHMDGGVTKDCAAVVSGVEIRNWLQYGVNVYGNKTGGIKISNCDIHDNGKTGDALSVGAGIVLTRAVSNISITGNNIWSNKGKGIFVSSAGENANGYTVTGNNCWSNGADGISFTEELNYGCIVGAGITGVTISGNNCRDNGRHGILIGTYNDVGWLRGVTVTGNNCRGNASHGILAQSNAAAANALREFCISGNVCTGNVTGLGLGANLIDGFVSGNTIVRNSVTNLGDASSAPSSNISVGENLVSLTLPALQTGTFTPTVSGSSSAGVTTYVNQSGRYTKYGNVVSFSLLVEWSGQTGSGNILIGGLPFTASVTEPQCPIWVFANSLTITGQATYTVSSGGNFGTLGAVNNGSYTTVAMDTAALLRISGEYRTDQ